MISNKTPTNVSRTKIGMPRKVIYTIVAAVFVVIGLAGLVIPIIPGILFIVGAVFLLSQVSSRVHQWSEGQAWMRDVRLRMIQLEGLHPLAKCRFVVLLAAKSVVSGIHKAVKFVSELLPARSL